ncbi:MAG: LytTR family DNA-binding domain-containing protein [Candidatus Gastranaerophilales bacterium]|nr:LytTR family DNA-binding domain-containing protein [Candidatus Gastranaerophilales bacterium]
MLRIAVCDDEELFLNRIVHSIKNGIDQHGLSAYEITPFLSGKDLLESSRTVEYGAIFLDINMPEDNGLEIAQKIRESGKDIILVFITSFMDYAIEGYKVEAMRFVLKDVLDEVMPECIDAIIRKLDLQAHKVKYDFVEGKREIAVDSIWLIESELHKLYFYISGQKSPQYSLYGKLDHMESELCSYSFLRIHKSFLVNTKYIDKIANYKVYLKNEKILPVPKEKFKEVRERYYEMMGELL